jgi:hypothetical protein
MSSVSTRKAMEESSLISVIIPAVNEAETLGATLTSVRAQTARCEIIVVDAQSTDETLALARGAELPNCMTMDDRISSCCAILFGIMRIELRTKAFISEQ